MKLLTIIEATNQSKVVDSRTILDNVESIHREYDDFVDGDLAERILAHDYYELVKMPVEQLHLDEWDVDLDLVDDMAEEIRNSPQTMYPIVIDQSYNSIIDGIHRANAYEQLGITHIPAYVSVDE